jgi:hypothetical protein
MAKTKTYKTKEKAAAALGISVAAMNTFGWTVSRIYGQIAYDLAEANGGRELKTAAAIECSLDAGRPMEELKREFANLQREKAPVEKLAPISEAITFCGVMWQKYDELQGAMRFYF